jgi:CRISPR-associated protein Cmr3
MQAVEEKEQQKTETAFKHLIKIEPLGFLYGSAGAFLSPENLVGRSGNHFPPSAAALSGIIAASLSAGNEEEKQKKKEILKNLQVAGPFFAKSEDPQNFYVPLPMNYLVKDGKIQHQMVWHQGECSIWDEDTDCEQSHLGKIWLTRHQKQQKWTLPPADKFTKGAWIRIGDWEHLQNTEDFKAIEIYTPSDRAWKFSPHLHPRLKQDERHVDEDLERGSLFLENGVQMNPDFCLVYLSNTKIENNGWYRFGGEGHMVDLTCTDLGEPSTKWLKQPVGNSFAIVTPAIWGSNRLSHRYPPEWQPSESQKPVILTERPNPFRYRMGGEGKEKRLSRGRYAVPAGSVYILKESLKSWQNWNEEWFPDEGYSYKRWGCGLALPLEGAIAPTN